MNARPSALFPLFAALDTLPGIGPKSSKALSAIGISRPVDLVFTLPQNGIQRRSISALREAEPTQNIILNARILRHRPPSRPNLPYRIEAEDLSGTMLQIIFFRGNGPYLTTLLPEKSHRVVSGKLELYEGKWQISHPDYVLLEHEAETIPEFEPIYPLTRGVSNRMMRKGVEAALKRIPEPPGEWIDSALVKEKLWPDWKTAVETVHSPENVASLLPSSVSRARLAYDAFFAHQLSLALARSANRRKPGISSCATGCIHSDILKVLHFELTGAQKRASEEIAADLASEQRMNRLLQGDVGAGKTIVALLAMGVAVEAGGQAVLMAPTEILARQHFETISSLADQSGLRLMLLTGRDKGKQRKEKLESLLGGQIDIVIGTHAVFQDDVIFPDLRLAIIDEQHRFGVNQRMALGAKNRSVDVLVMTATPIPRSLSLAHFGDMDVSILDEKPPGRQPVQTAMLPLERLDEVVERLSTAIEQGRQAYWVCPLVEESEMSDATAAIERHRMLSDHLGEEVTGLVHGQMPGVERDEIMARFKAGQIKVLVATTVIEVGVDVPQASIMVVERAENFGLAQLHQLRGRVGRGSEASACLLLYQSPLSENGSRRLSTLRESEDGFYIAEIDLEMRGSGDLIGTAQSGLPKFKAADPVAQASLMAIAQKDARKLLADDPGLVGPRGEAARFLLYLYEQDKAIQLLYIG